MYYMYIYLHTYIPFNVHLSKVFKMYFSYYHCHTIKYASSHIIHQHSYAPFSCNCSDSEMNRFYECRSGVFLGSKGLHATTFDSSIMMIITRGESATHNSRHINHHT